MKRSTVTLLAISITCLVGLAPQSSSAQSSGGHQIFAGTGKAPEPGQSYPTGTPAGDRLSIALGNPFGIEIRDQRVWITTVDDSCIYQGRLTGSPFVRIAGTGRLGYSGDGGPAVEAEFNWPHEVRSDAFGNLFVADTRNHVIRRIDAETGVVTTLAGSGQKGFAGDGESGSRVQFNQPHSVVLDSDGGLLVADTVNHRLRRIDLESGIVTTISGNGERKLPTDGAKANQVPLFGPRSLAVDKESIWLALREGNSIWRIDRTTNTIHHIAGTGAKGYSGDGGPPRQATFKGPKGLVMDDAQGLLVVDTENHAVRRIDLRKQVVETVLGGSAAAKSFELKRPHGISHAANFGYLVADSEFHRVIRGN